jgi:hypothetical protein
MVSIADWEVAVGAALVAGACVGVRTVPAGVQAASRTTHKLKMKLKICRRIDLLLFSS